MTPAREREWAERIAAAVDSKPDWTQVEKAWGKVEPLLAAFAKEVREEEREACAVLMEGGDCPPGKWPGPEGTFCRTVDHVQGMCECSERAAAIRAREKGGEG